MSSKYRPPYTITPAILRLVGEVGEGIGRYLVTAEATLTPRLRRGNRIRAIQASLAIENNTLSLEQVTAVLNGKRVLGLPREIQEVRNAYTTYENLGRWRPAERADLLEAHGMLMAGLTDLPGAFRSGNVGIFRGKEVVHMAPPGRQVRGLMDDLLGWLGQNEEHPLVASCVFHYELEFIHPFMDGNGRMGRLWQTLILSKWRPLLAYLPAETVIHDRQEDYYRVLAEADRRGDATPFIEAMLDALRLAIQEAVTTDQVTDQVNDQVGELLESLEKGVARAAELMKRLGLSHRATFRQNYLDPALAAGWIERMQPDSPRSPTQRYRITEKGRSVAARRRERRGERKS